MTALPASMALRLRRGVVAGALAVGGLGGELAAECSGEPSRREISFVHAEARLAATVLWIEGCVRGGAVVIHGSGDSDRGNRWAAGVAELLASQGLVTLFPDKRGTGVSGGDWRTGGYELLADDALAGLDALRATGLLPADLPVGLVGLSEGGRVAPIAVARGNGKVDFVVALSTGLAPFRETLEFEVRNIYRRWELGPEETERFLAADRAMLAYAAGAVEWSAYRATVAPLLAGDHAARARRIHRRGSDDPDWAWLRSVVDYDPLKAWGQVEVPVFFAVGAVDENVPVGRTTELSRRLLDSPSRSTWRFRVYPDTGHGLWLPGSTGVLHSELRADLAAFLASLEAS